MKTCPQCGHTTNSTICVFCAVEISSPNPSDFPPVTWQEIRDHFVQRLMIDPEWMVESEDVLTWWPGLVPQTLSVSSRVDIEYHDISETLVRVTIESELGTAIDSAAALDAVADLMIDYPFGSLVVLEDNRVLALASVALYGRNRPLLSLLHEVALVQATFAQDLSRQLYEDGIVLTDHPRHPNSGHRYEADELIQKIYGHEIFEPISDLIPIRDAVRNYWRSMMLQTNVELGFENDEVTFVTYEDRFDCAVGWRDDEFSTTKFGQSLMVWNNLAMTSEPLSAEEMNSLNLAIALETEYGLGHLGGITQFMNDSFNAIRHIAVLPYYFLQTAEHGIDGAVITAHNGILQAAASARYAHWLLNGDN